MNKELKNLTEKQDKEFDEIMKSFGVLFPEEISVVKSFIVKVRKETIECIADKIIEGNKILYIDNSSVITILPIARIKEEKEIKKQILKIVDKE